MSLRLILSVIILSAFGTAFAVVEKPSMREISEQVQPNYAEAPKPIQTLYEGDEEEQPPKTKLDREEEARLVFTALPYGHSLLGNIGGTAVITSPFIHSRYDFGGSGLIVNYSSIGKDVAALRQRQNFENQMHEAGMHLPGYPLLEISGDLETRVFAGRNFSGRHISDIDISNAEVDFQALANPWFTGFMTFAYDNAPPARGSHRVSNSDAFLDQGFIILGNLNRSPFYASAGQLFVPFGAFSSYLISNPINKKLFRTKARAITLGYQDNQITGDGLYASVYTFRGDTREGNFKPGAASRKPSANVNQYGGNIGYTTYYGDLRANFGASYIRNAADSDGMQATGAGGGRFGGFGTSSATEVLSHRVPAYDLRAKFSYHGYSLLTEYSSVTEAFSPVDLTFNGRGAKPSAYHVEGVYSFDMWNRPSTFAIGYDHSKESLGLNVPENRYAAAINSSIWRNTLLTVEYRHEQNYGRSDRASGSSGPVFAAPGQISNAVVGQFDIFF